MKTVYKYPLQGSKSTVKMPVGAKICNIGYQNGNFQIWAEVTPTNPEVERTFRIVPTGGHVQEGWEFRFTVVINNGQLVYHFYEEE